MRLKDLAMELGTTSITMSQHVRALVESGSIFKLRRGIYSIEQERVKRAMGAS